jgi:hypothetical protein
MGAGAGSETDGSDIAFAVSPRAATEVAGSVVTGRLRSLNAQNAPPPKTARSTIAASVIVVRPPDRLVWPHAPCVLTWSLGSDDGGVASPVADSPAERMTPEMRSTEIRERRGANGKRSAASKPTDS